MHRVYTYGWKGWQSVGLLVLRLVVGTAFILHGWPKIQNPMGWMGDRVHPLLQLASALAEFGGGIALIVGFLVPVVTLALAVNMAFALFLVHFPKGDPFVARGGGGDFELPLVYLAVMLMFFAVGPGRFSLDALLWRPRYVLAHERELSKFPRAA